LRIPRDGGTGRHSCLLTESPRKKAAGGVPQVVEFKPQYSKKKKKLKTRYQWLMPIILVIWEAEIRRMEV
jgi:hypothetical protein